MSPPIRHTKELQEEHVMLDAMPILGSYRGSWLGIFPSFHTEKGARILACEPPDCNVLSQCPIFCPIFSVPYL